VKGIGEFAIKNMEYLLARAEQELDVYYQKKKSSEFTVNSYGNLKVVYTFLLKGNEKQSVQSCLRILCRRGHAKCVDPQILEETKRFFNENYGGPPASILSMTNKDGEVSYALKTADGKRIPEDAY
jgi:hypothetical protein